MLTDGENNNNNKKQHTMKRRNNNIMAQIENLLYDFIRDNEIATESEIELVTNINGYSEETLNDIIHCRTGYHDVPQLYACEPENYYFSGELLEAYGLTEDEDENEEFVEA